MRIPFLLPGLLAFLGLGLPTLEAQTSDYLLHWNSSRCGTVQSARDAALEQHASRPADKLRLTWLSLMMQPHYALSRDPYLRDVYRISSLSLPDPPPWSGDTCVDFYEPFPEPEFCAVPNDPALTDLGGAVQVELNYMRVPEAWVLQPGAPGQVIGVVDVSVDTLHEDLYGRFVLVDAYDDTLRAHGTAVSGLAGAHTNNGLGIAAAGYGARIAFSFDGDVDGSVLKLARLGVPLVVVPWINRCDFSPIQQALYDEVSSLGTLVIASAGNGNSTTLCGGPDAFHYPASLAGVLSVSSVGHRYPRGNLHPELGAFNWQDVHNLHPLAATPITHTHNDSVDVVAPGHGLLTTQRGGGYAEAWGTSFSAPMVAGVAALVREANPCLSPDELIHLLKSTAYRIDTLPENLPYLGKLGAGRVDAQAAVAAALGGSNLVLEAGDDLHWTGLRRLRDTLVLEPGSRLLLSGKVYMAPGAAIWVKPGARLILDAAELLPGCGSSWAGIRVFGNPMAPPPSPAALAIGTYPSGPEDHGLIELRNGTVLRGADTALVLAGGAYVRGFDAEFSDNPMAVMARDYDLGSSGFFRNCTFSWHHLSPAPFSSLTRLSHQHSLSFQGCQWVSSHDVTGTRALELANSGVELRAGFCGGAACWPPRKGWVSGFDIGIESWTLSGTTPSPVRVENTAFEDCRRSLLLRHTEGAVLRLLDIRVGPGVGLGLPEVRYGIYLEGSPGALIEACALEGQGLFSMGVLVHAAGDATTLVSQCSAEGLYAGVVALGDNGGEESGLQVRCNEFNGNGTDVWLAPGAGPPSAALYQGHCGENPAGNRYGPGSAGSGPSWTADVSAGITWYAHHFDPLFTPSFNDEDRIRLTNCGLPYRAGDCPPPVSIPFSFALDSVRELTDFAAGLEAIFDNGSTEDLLRLIGAPGIPASLMQFALSEANPYLSDTVLLALIARYPDVSPYFFRFILESNSPLSPRVWAAVNSALPGRAVSWLAPLQGNWLSPRAALQAELSSLYSRIAYWALQRDAGAYAAGISDSLLVWYTSQPERLSSLYVRSGQFDGLGALLDSLGPDQLDRWHSMDLLRTLHDEARALHRLTAAEVLSLESWAAGTGRLAVHARQILRALDGRMLPEPLPSGPWTGLAFLKEPSPAEQLAHAGYKIWPNPAGSWVRLDGAGEGWTWELLDMQGRLRASGATRDGVALDLPALPASVYLLRLQLPDGSWWSHRLALTP
jgi:hypothetical protein